jgi:arylsulfatase A-like enzyme
MSKNELRIFVVNIIKNWLLPPKLQEVLGWFKIRWEKNNLKKWRVTPINTGLHFLENFKGCETQKYWLELKGEVRAGIIIDGKIDFSISEKHSNCKYLQIGVGTRKSTNVNSIKIFIDDVLCGHIEDLSDNVWHDLRLNINEEINNLNVRIEQSGIKTLYVSHPIFISKNEPSGGTKLGTPKNIICLVADAINFKCLKHSGEEIAPNIFKFFENGMFCNQAFTQADWTLPAFSSMLTGLHVTRHGVCNPGPNAFSLSDELITLPELMLKQGYRTFAHSGHIRFSPAYGHAKGFERFIFKPFSDENSFIAIQDVIFHLDAHKDESNFILMHVFDTHPPYKPTSYLKENLMKPFRDDRLYYKVDGKNYDSHQDNMDDEFKAKLKEFDVSISNLFSYLEKNNMVDDTLLIFTTDHGYSFSGPEKPRLLNERIHVPLLVRGPNIAKGEENSLIGNSVDLMPSILHYANIDIPNHIDGRAWPFLGGAVRDKVFSESLFLDKYSALIKDKKNYYHLNYPYDADSGSIDFKKRKPIVSYKRENLFDVEENVNLDEKETQKIYDEVENMYSSAKKYY